MKTEFFFTPYTQLDNAYLDAKKYVLENKESVHIIESSRGFQIVPAHFDLDRNYYHHDGRKVFFTLTETINV